MAYIIFNSLIYILYILYHSFYFPPIKKLDSFISAFRNSWYIENKTFGFDVIEHRLGGQMQRLKEIIYRVEKYLLGEIEHIEEFEQKKLPYNSPNEKGLVYKHNTKFIMSPFFPVV